MQTSWEIDSIDNVLFIWKVRLHRNAAYDQLHNLNMFTNVREWTHVIILATGYIEISGMYRICTTRCNMHMENIVSTEPFAPEYDAHSNTSLR